VRHALLSELKQKRSRRSDQNRDLTRFFLLGGRAVAILCVRRASCEPELGPTLDIDERVPEVASDHLWRVDAVDESGRGGRGGVHVVAVDRVDLGSDDPDERVDKADSDRLDTLLKVVEELARPEIERGSSARKATEEGWGERRTWSRARQ
jgi:hypothetical protein